LLQLNKSSNMHNFINKDVFLTVNLKYEA